MILWIFYELFFSKSLANANVEFQNVVVLEANREEERERLRREEKELFSIFIE